MPFLLISLPDQPVGISVAMRVANWFFASPSNLLGQRYLIPFVISNELKSKQTNQQSLSPKQQMPRPIAGHVDLLDLTGVLDRYRKASQVTWHSSLL